MQIKECKSPIKWMGGKSGSVDIIVPIIPPNKVYAEPFAGGAWILFNKEKSKVEVINDINGDLVNFYKVVQTDIDALLERMNFTLKSKELFLEYRETMHDENLSDLERAFRFYYVNQYAFGGLVRYNSSGKCNSPFGCTKDRPNPGSFWDKQKLIDAFERLKDVIVEHEDYKKLIKDYDSEKTVFFMDPPYDCKSGKYNGVSTFDYEELLSICQSIKGKFILTLNSGLYDLFKEFHVYGNDVHYSIACNSKSSKKYSEIIVTNFPCDLVEFPEN